ncbi:MAG TPA: TfoX/Sxy family protein [Phenylobacterium sp.]|jgi:TfoX/Sxy family transcriptional regulator of competence genes|nr:TfoX/Sxy family protein [Phenylobacterium sp.]
MAHDPKALQILLAAAAPPDLELVFKPMFGGILAYAYGKPLASLSDVGLALKASGALNAEFLSVPGAVALRYEPDAPASKTYVVVPDTLLSDRAALRGWIVRAAAGVAAAPAKKAKR